MKNKTFLICLTIISVLLFVKSQEDIPEKIMKTMREKLSTKELFKVYGLLYNKSYNYESEETIVKYKAFKQNLKRMDTENRYNFGFTDHFDMSEEEFKLIAEKSLQVLEETPKELYLESSLSAPLPAPIDHRTSLCITPVTIHKDMSFGVQLALVASTEFANCKRNGNRNVILSSQQFLDCERTTGSLVSDKHKYYIYKTGLYNVNDYPNTGARAGCKTVPGRPVYKINSFVRSAYHWSGMIFDIMNVYNALKQGPIIVGINFYDILYNYKGGVVSPNISTNACSFYTSVLVVGYGIENNVDYWVIRGFYGPTWGEAGYLRLKRDDSKLNWGINCGFIRAN